MKLPQTHTCQNKKQKTSHREIFLQTLICLLGLFAIAGPALAAISISGVADNQKYNDSVSFTINSEAGFDYTAQLNGAAIATDVAIEVDQPEYYELYVHRVDQSTTAEESVLIQFVVRASERGSSETGLPKWVPYPLIDSANAEFAGAILEIVTPAQYPMGLDIPVIARVENVSGKRLGVNGKIQAAGFQQHPLQLLRGVGSVFLPPATQPETISYTAQIASLQTPKQIIIEASTTWQTVSANITASTDWGQDARIRITGVANNMLTIAPGATLTIGHSSIILIDPDVTIDVQGSIIVNGTNQLPVVFTSQDRTIPWGGFLFESAAAQGQFTGSIFTASGADPDWFDNNSGKGSAHRKEQCLFYLSNGANVSVTDSYMIENHGQIGHGESAYLTMTGCLVQKCVTTGQYNHGAVVCNDTALIEFPSATAPFVDDDSDGFYLTGGAHSFTDSMIGWALDDGLDAGSGDAGSVTLENCWFESCYHEALAWSRSRDARSTGTVTINSGQGIECGYGAPNVDAANCLSTANAIGARFGDNYDWDYDGFLKVSDSLLLFNVRDVWGMAWDNWTVHLAQMDIQNNYLSIENTNHPNNMLWNPAANSSQLDLLVPFLAAPAGTVGVGLATAENTLDLANISNNIPVRLSSFTTNTVSVDYAVYTQDGLHDNGELQFIPGQTVKHIQFEMPSMDGLSELRITLSNPINAEITGMGQIAYQIPYEIDKQLVIEGDNWQYFKGTSQPPADWNQLSFDDSSWLTGPSGIGYETSSGYGPCIATNLTDMKNNYLSLYARREFQIDDPSQLTSLMLLMDYDDGYIAYINGVEVDSRNAPNIVAYDQPASSSSHEACCSCAPDITDLTDHISKLTPGTNVIAIQAHNATLSSSDFLLIPQLSAIITPWPGDFEPDGDVDLDDFTKLAAAWLTQDGQTEYRSVCDINTPQDGQIDMKDLLVFVENWLAGK